jgi:peptidoglycan hydrolase CwlO-like protein
MANMNPTGAGAGLALAANKLGMKKRLNFKEAMAAKRKADDDKAAAEAAKVTQAENSLRASKEQVGRQAELSAARQAAEGAARDASAAPVGGVDVRVASAAPETPNTDGVRKRRTRFGIGTESSGVNI